MVFANSLKTAPQNCIMISILPIKAGFFLPQIRRLIIADRLFAVAGIVNNDHK